MRQSNGSWQKEVEQRPRRDLTEGNKLGRVFLNEEEKASLEQVQGLIPSAGDPATPSPQLVGRMEAGEGSWSRRHWLKAQEPSQEKSMQSRRQEPARRQADGAQPHRGQCRCGTENAQGRTVKAEVTHASKTD